MERHHHHQEHYDQSHHHYTQSRTKAGEREYNDNHYHFYHYYAKHTHTITPHQVTDINLFKGSAINAKFRIFPCFFLFLKDRRYNSSFGIVHKEEVSEGYLDKRNGK